MSIETKNVGFTASTGYPTFYRTYSRKDKGKRESYSEVIERGMKGLSDLGNLNQDQLNLIKEMWENLYALPSGRWHWIGGTEWSKEPENYFGSYNCSNVTVEDWFDFFYNFDTLMQGCGTGTVVEDENISKLPSIKRKINLTVLSEPGKYKNSPVRPKDSSLVLNEETKEFNLTVGDTRKAWSQAFAEILNVASVDNELEELNINIEFGFVRPSGTPIKGFGGTANPQKLVEGFLQLVSILNEAVGRQLTVVEVCMILGISAKIAVSGNVRRSARINVGSKGNKEFELSKDSLWKEDENGQWKIDPEKDVLRYANHTIAHHTKPTLEEVVNSVNKQFYSGEGALQYVPEALKRCNVDILDSTKKQNHFIALYEQSKEYAKSYLAVEYLNKYKEPISEKELEHRLGRFGLNPCGEIISKNFLCVSKDTLIITKDGLFPIKDLVGLEVEIWNGERWSKVKPIQTGSERKLLRVKFGDGSFLDTTEHHRFLVKHRMQKKYSVVEAKDLVGFSKYAIHTQPFKIEYEGGINIDKDLAYTLGVMVGDGSSSTTKRKNQLVLHGQKKYLPVLGNKSKEKQYGGYTDTCVQVTNINDLDSVLINTLKNSATGFELIANWSKKSLLYFIAGLADTDGSNTESNGIRIYISDYERAKRLQLLLTKCGIRSSVNLMATKGQITNYGTRNKDMYYLQITDCNQIPCYRLDTSKGCTPISKGKFQVIKSVTELEGLHDTYCFEEPEFNNAVFGNSLTKNCNLSDIHLNQLDPFNLNLQEKAFKAGALSVSVLLHHVFPYEKLQYSREVDPIVGVSFTGLFDFFVKAFGVEWLKWWKLGRPDEYDILSKDNAYAEETVNKVSDLLGLNSDYYYYYDEVEDVENGYIDLARFFIEAERCYLEYWRGSVKETVEEYCLENNLRVPNRCTTVQPSGTKALLTGASPGWHPPKAERYIRRITFRRDDPVALACIDYGYNVLPSQSCTDDNGNLLNDPYDDRVTEWLIEIPVQVDWAELADEAKIDTNLFTAEAQYKFYMQVQKFYTEHNTSATIEFRKEEIEMLSTLIYNSIQSNEGYISAALLARFDSISNYPRLPFEPITKEVFEEMEKDVLKRRKTNNFEESVNFYDGLENKEQEIYIGGCDSEKCEIGSFKSN